VTTTDPTPASAAQAAPAGPVPWARAREIAYEAGVARRRAAVSLPLDQTDGLVIAQPLLARTDLPAFATASVDGWAVRGAGPWRVSGRILAGDVASPLEHEGTGTEIATGAMVPAGTTALLRLEDGAVAGDSVSGTPRDAPEWRVPGEEATAGEEMLPAGTSVSPAVMGFAAACGYDELVVWPAPAAAVLVFGDELLSSGLPGNGRVRDALGPPVPAWLRRLGATCDRFVGPVEDTLEAHVEALRAAAAGGAGLICTTGGTMRGPVDHLHGALAKLGATYLVDSVAVRPGFPMLLAALPDGPLVAGLPGNPQSAIVALVSLVAPAMAGLAGRPMPALPPITLGAPVDGRGDFTHLALVRLDEAGHAHPLRHAGSAMLRGLAQSVGFAVIVPGGQGDPGARVPLVPLPLVEDRR
jgi:molybdopterin molybdotransferase